MVEQASHESALKLQEEATALFRDGDFQKAANLFEEAASKLRSVCETTNELRALFCKLLQNVALASTKVKDFEKASKFATMSLQVDPYSVKGLYLRSFSSLELGIFDSAVHDCRQGLQIKNKDSVLQGHW